jgi:hypothetical protein
VLTRYGWLLLITLLIATACGSNADYDNDDEDTGASPSTNPNTVLSTESPTVATSDRQPVPEALRFRAPLVGGGEIDVSTLADRPVVLWFWAPY